jgi:hypothetical protein
MFDLTQFNSTNANFTQNVTSSKVNRIAVWTQGKNDGGKG